VGSFEYIDISGDVGLRAFGATLEEAFINASLGMYSLITNTDSIALVKTAALSVESQSLDGLLVSWLNELIFRFDAYGFIGKKVTIDNLECDSGDSDSLNACRLSAVIEGEEFDPERHEGKLLIKAATYHGLRIEKNNGHWAISVIFDI
jgi:SHS2 domain-containing protein